MHKDIKIMIELQRYWNNILENKEHIARANKNIDFWKNDLKSSKEEFAILTEKIKNLKNKIKQNELELANHDEKIKKLRDRRNTLQSEKELTAVDKEIEKVKNDQGSQEETLIALMEDLDEKEKKHAALAPELSEKEQQVGKDLSHLENNIKGFEQTIADNQGKLDTMSENLSTSVKTRFIKLLHSKKDGKGIGEVKGEICGACNFQIPASLAVEASKDATLTVCTNCGRYIYKQ